MKLQYVDDLPDLLEALNRQVGLCVTTYVVPITAWNLVGPGWVYETNTQQQYRTGEHTVVCIPNEFLEVGVKILESPSRLWEPLDQKLLFWDEQELGPCPCKFGFYCLESHQRLFSAVEQLAGLLSPELVIPGLVDGKRSEQVARNVYDWVKLFQISRQGRVGGP